ncbi:MAG: periplasmic heavy metal sensor [Candidatus Omnitrophica bacterium]|nr:periplasmic heavy metal sensor [Candidatus Omnitrophota bacterium]
MRTFFRMLFLNLFFLSSGILWAQTVEVDLAAAGYDVSSQEETILGISNLQSQRMVELGRDFLSAQNLLREQIKSKRDTLRQELSLENPDRSKIQSLANEILAAQGKIADNRINYIFMLRDVLSPDQLKILHKLRAESQARLKTLAEERERLRQEKIKGGNTSPLSINGNKIPSVTSTKKQGGI